MSRRRRPHGTLAGMENVTPPKADPQTLLPPELRSDWAVVPRLSLYWLFTAGAIVGAGAALSVVGFVIGGPAALRWVFPAALVVAASVQVFVSRGERNRLAALRDRA